MLNGSGNGELGTAKKAILRNYLKKLVQGLTQKFSVLFSLRPRIFISPTPIDSYGLQLPSTQYAD